MSSHRYADVFQQALPIAVLTDIAESYEGTAAENNLRAQTSSLSSAASLSGCMTTAAGENGFRSWLIYPTDTEPRTACIDPIAVMLATFAREILIERRAAMSAEASF